MAQFFADITGILELFAIAGGLVLLHRASKDAPARLLKAAGWVLVAGGIAVGLCTSYYWLQYQSRGDFAGAYLGHPGMMSGPGGGMGYGMGSMSGMPMHDCAARPEAALKRRYAEGEIDRSTYERMLEELHE